MGWEERRGGSARREEDVIKIKKNNRKLFLNTRKPGVVALTESGGAL